jgi:hypothetical protein
MRSTGARGERIATDVGCREDLLALEPFFSAVNESFVRTALTEYAGALRHSRSRRRDAAARR